jgi:hypothetical protein
MQAWWPYAPGIASTPTPGPADHLGSAPAPATMYFPQSLAGRSAYYVPT